MWTTSKTLHLPVFTVWRKGILFSLSTNKGLLLGRFNNNYLFIVCLLMKIKAHQEVDKLGQKASHGCIRLSMDDSLWFYENIPQGTPVIIKE